MGKIFDEIKVLYEDENLAVLNKPAGIMVHGDGRTEEKTLTDWILEKYPETKEVGEPIKTSSGQVIEKPGIVHRLDRETSGAIIVAKNQKAYLFLKEQFQNREIEKTYSAFVLGKVKNDEGTIDRPIGRSGKDFRQRSAMRGARGILREAVTDYRVISRSKDFTFLEAKPKTGRTHQIRVHFKAINHPVVCDKLYSPNLSKSEAISDKLQSCDGAPKKECALGFSRLALHAHKIKFKNLDGKEIEIEAPYPEDFERAIRGFLQKTT